MPVKCTVRSVVLTREEEFKRWLGTKIRSQYPSRLSNILEY
jgi:hypothetical protein